MTAKSLSRNVSMSKPIALDLFCGCGGLSAGIKSAGFKVVGAVDIDPLSLNAYKANHRNVHLWEADIRTLDPRAMREKIGINVGELDLLAGCPPCQGFSSLRTLNGAIEITDMRNNLLFEFLRFAEVFKPKSILMENVPGLAADSKFSKFVKAMTKLGYKGQYAVLDASQYGVPQRRRRLVYVAGIEGKISFAKKARKSRTVADAIKMLPKAGASGDPLHDIPEKRSEKVLNIIKKIPRDGGSRKDLPKNMQLECHKRCDGFGDVYGRMSWGKVSPTITSGCFNPSKGRFLHPDENRAITMREASLLQSFSPKYKFPDTKSKTALALMIGNALPPEFIRRQAVEIIKSLS